MGGVLVGLLIATTTGCRTSQGPITGSDQLLGTLLQVAIHDDGYDRRLIDRAFERVAEIERRMSTSEDDYDTTELLEVNRNAGFDAVTVSPETFSVVSAAAAYSELTAGSFDVTIWPLVRLWRIGSGGTSVPAENEIRAAQALVDYRELQLDETTRELFLPRQGMGVDVGAIAKGYAADEAARILREAGVEHALLDFGGNILVIGNKPDGSPWRIGIQRPDAERSRYLGIVSTANRTVVTSGPYERFFMEDGVRYHHILNPKTGFPARNGIEQVTIIADVSMDADALSTSTYVMGLERGMQLVESLEGVEAIFVMENRNVHLTRGAAEMFDLTDEAFNLVLE